MCGIFPNVLKTSKIIPFHKKELSFSNYQPISLLSNIDEILERIMYNRLYIFLEKNEFIFFWQFGFRWRHSATYALLIHLTELIKNDLGDVNYGRGIFFDSQKTFDTVDHDILLKKLERMALGESLINGLHQILLIEIHLFRFIGLIWIWLTLLAGCLRLPFWVHYCF